jgi:hypothetical protein
MNTEIKQSNEQLKMIGSNGKPISIGDVVLCNDDYLATVIDIVQDSDDTYYAVVTDQEGNEFDLDYDNIEYNN